MPATGGTIEGAWQFIKELCNRHRGEVRELTGTWEQFDGPLPHQMLNPQFHGSFIRESGEMALQGLAPGSCCKTGELEVRVARVCGLVDLFLALGEEFTAAELYQYYQTCRVIATRRSRGQKAW